MDSGTGMYGVTRLPGSEAEIDSILAEFRIVGATAKDAKDAMEYASRLVKLMLLDGMADNEVKQTPNSVDENLENWLHQVD